MSNDQIQIAWRPPNGPPDIEHHTKEWTSGTRGGGKLPADFEWGTNPKTHQEEAGASQLQPPALKK